MKRILCFIVFLFFIVPVSLWSAPYDTIQFRRGTTAAWAAANPILAQGEPAIETDASPPKLKIGDGTTHWNGLSYQTVDVTAMGLAVLDTSNNFTQNQKLKGTSLIWRFKDTNTGGVEYGIRSTNGTLQVVQNIGTESSPSWVLITAFSSALDEHQGGDLSSASTVNLGAASGNYVNITGTNTITGFDIANAGVRRIVNFTGILTLTYNATSLMLPTAANMKTAVGDVATFISLGSGNWKCISYNRADGTAVGNPGAPTVIQQRNTVISSSVDTNGQPNFLSVGSGLKPAYTGAATPIILAFASGFLLTGAIDYTAGLATDGTVGDVSPSTVSYIYVDRNTTSGVLTVNFMAYEPSVNLSPIYQANTPQPVNLCPSMNSLTTPSGTVSASSTTGTYYAWQAFDSFNGNMWYSANKVAWLRYRFPHAQIIANYTINTQTEGETGAPKDWTFQGSNDAVSWHTLDTQTNQTGWTSSVARSFTFTNVTPYIYYQLSITDNNGDGAGNRIDFLQLKGIYQNQHWYNTQAHIMKYYSSTAIWSTVQRVFIGEASANSTDVTSVVNYALNGKYDSGDMTTTATSTTVNHNVGIDNPKCSLWEGLPGSRTLKTSTDIGPVTRNRAAWTAVAGTSRMTCERPF